MHVLALPRPYGLGYDILAFQAIFCTGKERHFNGAKNALEIVPFIFATPSKVYAMYISCFFMNFLLH